MLMSLTKVSWAQGLENSNTKEVTAKNEKTMKELAHLAANYNKWI